MKYLALSTPVITRKLIRNYIRKGNVEGRYYWGEKNQGKTLSRGK
jgi:hypothetical protein